MKIKIQEVYKKFKIFIEEKSLTANIFIGISKFIGLVFVFILVVWGLFFLFKLLSWGSDVYSRWEEKNRSEVTFSKLVNADDYSEKIIGIKTFELSLVANLVESNDVKRYIPVFSHDAIFFDGNKKRVFLWRAMPKFFPDVEFGAHKIRCVQGRVRKKISNISFDKFEDKFFVMYDNAVLKESDKALKARLKLFLDENQKKREEQVGRLSNERVESHSVLFSGNCVETFQGWVIRELD
jgi:hypothetical protein